MMLTMMIIMMIKMVIMMIKMVMVTKRTMTNNENDSPVHICPAPTLKSSWEAVLQVSVNKYFV